jgi:hypothetical protein
MRNVTLGTTVGLILTAAIAGCSVVGPASVRTGRGDYNIAVQQTNAEQLLLNLVRLRYRDVPYFLEVASVSTSFELNTAASAGVSLPESAGNVYDLGAEVAVQENPTVTYTPLQGEQFVTQLMSPVSLDTLLLLYHSGWSIERVFRVALQSINDVRNAPSASGPTPDYVPRYKRFLEVTKLLRTLQIRHVLSLGHSTAAGTDKPFVEMRVDPKALGWDEVKQLCNLLNIEPGRGTFRLTTERGAGGKDRVAVATRSLSSILFYVSQGVAAPERDELAGRVTVTRDEHGSRFDWNEVTGGLMRIASSSMPPDNAYVAVRYRGSWFYVNDSDLTSKSTFSLLMQLFALQAGDVRSAGPILTLPVGR